MKKTIQFLITSAALLTGLISSGCTEESVEDLENKIVDAMKNGETENIRIYARKACEKNSVYGCHTLGGLYERESDFRNATIYLEKSCSMNSSPWSERSCAVLGLIYNKGLGVEKDIAKGESFLEKGCNLNLKDGYGCYAIAERLIRLNDYEGAIPYFENGCILNTPEACSELGTLYFKGLGTNVDKVKASVFFEKACDLKDGHGCYLASAKYMLGYNVPADTPKAVQYFKKSCELGVREACVSYAQFKKD